jgi:hypothetical protein
MVLGVLLLPPQRLLLGHRKPRIEVGLSLWSGRKPQISPLRCAPVDMTISLWGEIRHFDRAERSGVSWGERIEP